MRKLISATVDITRRGQAPFPVRFKHGLICCYCTAMVFVLCNLRVFFSRSYLLFVFVIVILPCLFLAALWSPVWKRADLLALFYVMFACVFVTFS